MDGLQRGERTERPSPPVLLFACWLRWLESGTNTHTGVVNEVAAKMKRLV